MESDARAGWEHVTLAELVVYAIGGDWGKSPDCEDESYRLVRCIRASEMKNWEHDRGKTAALRKIKRSSLSSRELRSGDIILEISGGGPEQPVGRTVLIDGSCLSVNPETPKICTNFFRLLRSTSAVDSRFLNQYLQHFHAGPEIKKYQGGSNNLRNLRFQDYLTISVPLPPLAEQRRIVAKIEELFSELDKGVENLKTARAQLKTYRQSLLKAAFEGRLTERWRRDNADKLETADQLLERIRVEREARYHQQLEEWKVALAEWESGAKLGKKPRKRSPPNEMPPPLESELAVLPDLPEGWHWEWLGNISEVSGGLTKNQKRKQFSLKRRFLRVANVYANQLILDEVHEIGITKAEAVKTTLQVGDLLIVEGNGSVDQIGRVAVWDGSIENCVHQNHLIRARLLESVLPRFALWFLLSKQGRELIVRTASSTSGLHTLSLSKVQNLLVPVCSSAEQSAVLEILDARLSQVDQMEKTVVTALQKTDALRQSILKRAFEGKLVPQDPDDEPASALLERIRQEQADAPKPKRRKRKTEASA